MTGFPGGVLLRQHKCAGGLCIFRKFKGTGYLRILRLFPAGRPGLLLRRRTRRFPPQQLIRRHPQHLRQCGEQGDIRDTVAAFPFGHGFIGHAQPLRQLLLREAHFLSAGSDKGTNFLIIHQWFLLLSVPLLAAQRGGKSRAVSRPVIER